MSRRPRSLGELVVRGVGDAVRARAVAWRRELRRPWREGRPGRPAEIGRWIGFGLAAGAFAAGVAAAVWAEWERR